MKKILLLLSGIMLVVVVVAVAGLWYVLQPMQPEDLQQTEFVVPKGQAVSVIGKRLTEAGFIRHPLVFRYVVWQQGLSQRIQAGTFLISKDMTPGKIAKVLTAGSQDIWITLPEGWRKEEVAQSLVRQELPNFELKTFEDLAGESEGKLFPDTYLVPENSTAEDLYTLFTTTFERKVTQGLAKEIKNSGRDLDEVIIMASLIEREARGFEEMQMVAGILWKRIEIGMPLQVDATLQYAKGFDAIQKNWWATPLADDRKTDSAYNTYTRPGLPPGPIANPGIDAIKAALQPKESDYLFYIHDRKGEIHYAKTLEEHNANVNTYLR